MPNQITTDIDQEATGMLNLLLSEAVQKLVPDYPCLFDAKLSEFFYEDAFAGSSMMSYSTIVGQYVGHNVASISVMHENDCTCNDEDFKALLNGIIQDVRSQEEQINSSLQSTYSNSSFSFLGSVN